MEIPNWDVQFCEVYIDLELFGLVRNQFDVVTVCPGANAIDIICFLFMNM